MSNKPGIHFIGTAHNDPQGPERLQKALEYEQPDIVTVEFDDHLLKVWEAVSNYRNDFLNGARLMNTYFNQGLDDMIERLATYQYEVAQALEFEKKYDLLVKGVDYNPTIPASRVEQATFLLSPYVIFLDTQRICSKMDVVGRQATSLFKRLLYQRCESLLAFLRVPVLIIESRYDIFQRYFDAENVKQKFPDLDRYCTEHELSEISFGENPEDIERDAMASSQIEQLVQPDIKIVHVGGLFHGLDDAKDRTLFSKLRKYNPTRATLKWYEDK